MARGRAHNGGLNRDQANPNRLARCLTISLGEQLPAAICCCFFACFCLCFRRMLSSFVLFSLLVGAGQKNARLVASTAGSGQKSTSFGIGIHSCTYWRVMDRHLYPPNLGCSSLASFSRHSKWTPFSAVIMSFCG